MRHFPAEFGLPNPGHLASYGVSKNAGDSAQHGALRERAGGDLSCTRHASRSRVCRRLKAPDTLVHCRHTRRHMSCTLMLKFPRYYDDDAFSPFFLGPIRVIVRTAYRFSTPS